eukprot:1137908-Pelagomonas_calceolata.AAC.3
MFRQCAGMTVQTSGLFPLHDHPLPPPRSEWETVGQVRNLPPLFPGRNHHHHHQYQGKYGPKPPDPDQPDFSPRSEALMGSDVHLGLYIRCISHPPPMAVIKLI